MRGLMGSGCRTSCPIPLERSPELGRTRRTLLIRGICSKIFPPTPEDLSAKEEPAESESLPAKPAAGEAPAVSKDTSTGAPQAKKLNTSTEDLGKDDWEAVEKPNEATSDEAADMSEEGEKVEAVEFGGSDGEKVGKSIEKQKGESKADAVQSENMLAKDW